MGLLLGSDTLLSSDLGSASNTPSGFCTSTYLLQESLLLSPESSQVSKFGALMVFLQAFPHSLPWLKPQYSIIYHKLTI